MHFSLRNTREMTANEFGKLLTSFTSSDCEVLRTERGAESSDYDEDTDTYGEPVMYASTPMGHAAMHALKYFLHTTDNANHAALARAIHDHIGAVGIRQADLFSKSSTNRIIAFAIEKCPPLNDYVIDLAIDTIKLQLSTVYGFEPHYFEQTSSGESGDENKLAVSDNAGVAPPRNARHTTS